MFSLVNEIQRYAWGSESAIQTFLGDPIDGRPAAEVWMGTHPLAPSSVETPAGRVGLRDHLGEDLPYLLKVLAAGSPLSLQVHPELATARAGFAAEEARGLALSDPARMFKDPRHKPEMAYALTDFEALIGFRPTAELWDLFDVVDTSLTTRLSRRLHEQPGYAGIVRLLDELLDPRTSPAADEMDELVQRSKEIVHDGRDLARACETLLELHGAFPADPGVVTGMLLNRVSLAPGEAAFLAPGILHAHLSGTCLEVMASSDNVLRAGLTPKHVDRRAVIACLVEGMSTTALTRPMKLDESTLLFQPPVDEFGLLVTSVGDHEPILPGAGPRIALCIEGGVTLTADTGAMSLVRGDSVLLADVDGVVRATGPGRLAQAFCPATQTRALSERP